MEVTAVFRLAVDFGTATTAAAVQWPDGTIRPLPFDGAPTLPSLVGLDAEHKLVVGEDGRAPADGSVAPKRLIDQAGTTLGGVGVPVDALFAAVFRRVADEARGVVDGPFSEVVLTHPAGWPAARTDRLARAARDAGLGPVRLLPDPVAAAAWYVRSADLRPGGAVIVCDFGGGTFDASVVRRETDGVAHDGSAPDGFPADAPASGGFPPDGLPAGDFPPDGFPPDGFPPDIDRVPSGREPAPADRHRGPVDRDRFVIVASESVPETTDATVVERAVEATVRVIQAAGLRQDEVRGLVLVGGAGRTPLAGTLLHQRLGLIPAILEQPDLAIAQGALAAPRSALSRVPPGPPPGARSDRLAGSPPERRTATPRSEALPAAPPTERFAVTRPPQPEPQERPRHAPRHAAVSPATPPRQAPPATDPMSAATPASAAVEAPAAVEAAPGARSAAADPPVPAQPSSPAEAAASARHSVSAPRRTAPGPWDAPPSSEALPTQPLPATTQPLPATPQPLPATPQPSSGPPAQKPPPSPWDRPPSFPSGPAPRGATHDVLPPPPSPAPQSFPAAPAPPPPQSFPAAPAPPPAPRPASAPPATVTSAAAEPPTQPFPAGLGAAQASPAAPPASAGQGFPAGAAPQAFPAPQPTTGFPAGQPAQPFPAAQPTSGFPAGARTESLGGGPGWPGLPGGPPAHGVPGSAAQGPPGGSQPGYLPAPYQAATPPPKRRSALLAVVLAGGAFAMVLVLLVAGLVVWRITAIGDGGANGRQPAAVAPTNGCPPLADEAIVLLTDDKRLQIADNVVPVLYKPAVTPALLPIVDRVGDALDVKKLAGFNKAVQVDKKSPASVAIDFAAQAGLTNGIQKQFSGTFPIGAMDFPESNVLANLYQIVLGAAGFTATIQPIPFSADYQAPVERGTVKLMPAYTGSLAENLNRVVNGPSAPAVSSSDLDQTMQALTRLAGQRGLTVGKASKASDQFGFAVTRKFADRYGVTTLSQFAGKCSGADTVLGGPRECEIQAFCQVGLEKTYGLHPGRLEPLDSAGPLTKLSLKSGRVTVGLISTTDPDFA